METLRTAAEMVSNKLADVMGTKSKPEKHGGDLASFAKDMEPAGAPETKSPRDSSSGAVDQGKAGLSERVEGLASDILSRTGPMSHDINAPSHERFRSTDVGTAAAVHQVPVPRENFVTRTYHMVQGAETPDGLVEALHLHEDKGCEFEGAPIAGKTVQFGSVPQGAGAPTSQEDRPIKMMTHNYHHEGVAVTGGDVEASRMSMEAGGEPMGQDLPEDILPGGGSEALSGNVPHLKDFESETNMEARGGESPDGTIASLHLHAVHGREGAGSKADQQLGDMLKSGSPRPPMGAGATTSEQDPPDKMMTHHKVEAGVLGRTGVLPSLTKEPPTEETTTTPLFEDTTPETETETGTGGGSSAMAGMVPHQKDFETEANFEAKGAETPDGPVEALHLHADHGLEGSGSKADQLMGQFIKEGAHPPGGTFAPASDQDRPFKITQAYSGYVINPKTPTDTTTSPDDARIITGSGLERIAAALAETGNAPDPGSALLHGQDREIEKQLSNKMLQACAADPYQGDDIVMDPEQIMLPAAKKMPSTSS